MPLALPPLHPEKMDCLVRPKALPPSLSSARMGFPGTFEMKGFASVTKRAKRGFGAEDARMRTLEWRKLPGLGGGAGGPRVPPQISHIKIC